MHLKGLPEVYRRYLIEKKFNEMNFAQFNEAIERRWDISDMRVDWQDFEHLLRDIIRSSTLTAVQKVVLVNDAIGAYTGRGPATMHLTSPREALKETT